MLPKKTLSQNAKLMKVKASNTSNKEIDFFVECVSN